MSDAAYVSMDDRFNQLRLSEGNPAHIQEEKQEEEKRPPALYAAPALPASSATSSFIPAYQPQSYSLSNAEYKDPSASSSSSAFPPSLLPNPTPLPLASMSRLYAGSSWRPEKALGEPVVIISRLSKSYTLPGRSETVQALKSIDLSLESSFYPILKGEFVMIRGPSGGGKTTLLNILGTIDEPSSGELTLLGENVDSRSPDSYLASLRLRKIGFVFQTFNLLATMSAFENVELPMTILGERSAKECKARAMQLLDMVGLQDRYAHLPSELSGGEQQRVTIARALSNEPELLLLDEPTGDLDTRNTVDIMDLILRVNQEQSTTCVMVTHNPDLECQTRTTLPDTAEDSAAGTGSRLCTDFAVASTFHCLLCVCAGYADRILYVEDGQFKKQAINRKQVRLDYISYMHYISSQRDG